MDFYKLPEGKELVRAARSTIELYIKDPRFDRKIIEGSISSIKGKHGMFVTIENYPSLSLRGCVGYIEGIKEINSLLVDAALAAAFDDPRFPPLSADELDQIAIEVSILSEKAELGKAKEERLANLEIGRHGLIIEYGVYSGLLLPNVAVEEHFGKVDFLEAVCRKAGLPANSWQQPNVHMYTFETQIFREEKPNGSIKEVKN